MVKGASRTGELQASGWGFLPVAVAFVLLLLAVSPQGDFPLNDDWIYSSAVKQRLATGHDVIDMDTSAYLYPQRFYGTALGWLFGFSFTLMRVSGLLAAFACLVFAYRILARLGFRTFLCFAGTVALLANPIFLNLSYTFMTDIPYLAFFLAALLLYIRAAQTGEKLALWGASFLTIIALTQRQTGLLLTPAVMIFFFLQRKRRPLSPFDWAVLLLPVAAFAALTAARGGGNLQGFDPRWLLNPSEWAKLYRLVPLSKLRQMAGADPLDLFAIVTLSLPAYLGLFTLPLLLGGWLGSLRKRAALPAGLFTVSALCAGGFFAAQSFLQGTNVAGRLQVTSMPFLTNILNRCGVGPAAGNVLAGECVSVLPDAAWQGVTIAAVLGGALLSALGIHWGFRKLLAIRWKALAYSPSGEERAEKGVSCVGLMVLAGAFQILPFYVVWPQDRYLLPLLLPAAVLVLETFRNVRWSAAATALGLIIFYLYGAVSVQDYLSWNRVRWELSGELLAEGVPPEHIDGGFEWHGWHFAYKYPRSVKPKRTSPYLLWFTHIIPNLDPVYAITFGEVPGYSVLRVREFPTHLPRSDPRMYLLKRNEP